MATERTRGLSRRGRNIHKLTVEQDGSVAKVHLPGHYIGAAHLSSGGNGGTLVKRDPLRSVTASRQSDGDANSSDGFYRLVGTGLSGLSVTAFAPVRRRKKLAVFCSAK